MSGSSQHSSATNLPAGFVPDSQQPPNPASKSGQYSPADIESLWTPVTQIDWSKYATPQPAAAPVIDWSKYENAAAKTPATPSLLDRAEKIGSEVWDTMPGVGTLHQASGAVQDWAQRHEPLNDPRAAAGLSPTEAALKQGATGVLADVAGLVHGASSPLGVAATAAAIAAPEVVAPAMIAHGGYSAVKGWGDLRNPDVLQRELNAGAEIAGGASLGAEALRAGGGAIVQSVKARRAAQVPAQAASDLMGAVPATKSTPYTPADYQAARPYLEREHAGSPIESVAQLRDAADSAIGKIEDAIEDRIASLPQVRFKTSGVLQDVKTALNGSPRGQSFVDAGLKDLDDFHLNQPKTLAEADSIRRQLNAENQAVLQRNNYKVANARATDPAFAAREAASESLRDGIYNQLAANGMPGARQLRLDEGSLIKVRNAAQAQAFSGERIVGSTRSGLAARAMRNAGRVAGAGIGASLGGPGGAIAGEYIGDTAGTALAPKGMTRDQLVARSFRDVPKPVPPRVVPVARPALRVVRRAVPAMVPLSAMVGSRSQ